MWKTTKNVLYNYLREIILRRVDYQEYKITEKDFRNLYPNDFEDLFLLNIQEKLNHLTKTNKTSLHTAVNMWIRNLVIRNRVGDLQLGIESYQTKINLERPNWDATDYYFKEDYTIVPKPRVVVYRDRNDQRKLMRLNELYKFNVNDDNFAERMVALINQRKGAFAEQTAKEKRDKIMTPAQQREYMKVFVKNQSATIYSTGWTMKRAGEALEPDTSKKQKSTKAPIPSVPYVSSPKYSGTMRKSLGRSRITKPRSILT
ncbi:hypothetical protein Tco_0037477 [Tanacetum coccineum]